jgi:hypothetical protein
MILACPRCRTVVPNADVSTMFRRLVVGESGRVRCRGCGAELACKLRVFAGLTKARKGDVCRSLPVSRALVEAYGSDWLDAYLDEDE